MWRWKLIALLVGIWRGGIRCVILLYLLVLVVCVLVWMGSEGFGLTFWGLVGSGRLRVCRR